MASHTQKSFRLSVIPACAAAVSIAAFAQENPQDSTNAEENYPYWVSAELGAVWQSRNDVEIPKGSSTRFSFLDFGTGPFLAGRIYAGARFADVHEARVLFAPFQVSASGHLKQNTTFMNKQFLAASKTNGVFRFNSYRATYRYTLFTKPHWNLKAGFTGKIRDAEITLEQGNTKATRTNVGFVPLLHLAANYALSPKLELQFDADALAAPQGRAEDVAFTMAYTIDPQIQVYGGYRTVEGGADAGSQDGGSKVYNFIWFHAVVMGTTLHF
jgi:hypothetical protein